MPWSPFSHVPKKTGREGTPESEPSNLARKKKRPSYLQEFDLIAEGLEDNTPPVKEIEPEKEKKAAMPSIQEKPEAKVKEKSSYKKLISNLQTTYPDLSQEEALKGILALRVQNNGTLTGMTMLEIMERVIQFARPEKGKQKEQPEPEKEPVAIEKTQKPSESKKSYSKPENGEAEAPTNGDNAIVSPSKTAKVDIPKLDKSPKPVKTYSKQNVGSEDKTVPDTEETSNKKGKKKNDLDDSADDKEVEETPKKRKQNLDISKKASNGIIKARESSLESVDDLLQSEQSAESDAYIEPEPSKKSPIRKKKASPKKKADKEEKALSDSEENENVGEDDEEYNTPKKSDRKKKDKVQTPKTTSKPRGKKKEIEETIEEEKDEESDASFKPEPSKKSHKKKASPKKKEEPAEEDSDGEADKAEDSDASFKPEPSKKSHKKKATPKKKEEPAEEESDEEADKAEESDASFKPEPPKKSHKKKASPKKKKEPVEEDSDGEVEVKVAKRSPQKSKRKEETIKAMEVTEEDQPRTSRKRKVPSYLKEFAVEEAKASEEPEKEDGEEDPAPETPKQRPSKRRKIEAEPEPEPEPEPETPKRKKATAEPKTPKRKKGVSDTATPKSKQKKKAAPSTTEYGECVLCGLMFDEESTKFCMTDKTRETGQTFADILFGLFHEESLPPSLAEKAKAVDLDGGSLCTLCVSHVDQLDVFQQKVTDIKTSIISIFIQKTRNDSLNQGEIESGDSETEEEAAIVAKVTPKKKGKKGKGKAGKLVTLVYQSPLKKVRDLEAMSEKEISKMTEMVIKYTPKKSKKAKASEDDHEEEDLEEIEEEAPVKKIESKPDPDLALKLSALSGIEIKRVNTDTGDESLQISGLAGIEIKKIDDSSSEKKTPSKKKTPKKEKTPGKTPGKRGRPKKSIEVAGEPVFEEACEELQNDLGAHVLNGEKNQINGGEQAATPVEVVGPPPAGNVARGAMMPNIPVRGGPIRMSPGRGGRGARGVPRGGMGRGMVRPGPPGMNFRPTPPKSKKSLFELSQNKRKMGTLVSNNGISIAPRTPVQNTPVLQNFRVNGIQATSTPIMAATVQTLHVPVTPLPVSTPVTLTPSKLNGLHGISITSSVTMSPIKEADIQAPAEVKEKKAYKKLISKIQAVHPDMSHEEAMRGIVALRTANNGTLTGMSMTEIITKVRANVRGEEKAVPMETETETETQATNSPAPPVGEAFEKIVNEALAPDEPPQSEMFLTPTKSVDPATLYEIKCKFCSRLFKSSSETATKKVYEIHIQEHEKETRSIFDKEAPETELTVAAPDPTQNSTPTLAPANNTEDNEDPDPVKSEKSYCKPCHKQFKSGKLYGAHQNTEHAAEIEFEKIMSSP